MRDTAPAERALAQCDLAYIGIRPADGELESPAMLLGSHNAHGLSYALDGAARWWPKCTRWALVASDERLMRMDPAWPPGVRQLTKPQVLAAIVETPAP